MRTTVSICLIVVIFSSLLLLKAYAVEVNPIMLALVPDEIPAKKLEVPSIFSDNMVLQQKKTIPVWGRAKKGETVTVEFAGQKISTTAENGRWAVNLVPVAAGGPYELKVSSENEEFTYKNVMVGEVWICGGQSNMVMMLKEVDEGREDSLNANFPQIRYFTQSNVREVTPKLDVSGGKWEVISPQTALNCSALGYYFGTTLHQDMNVPIGLINVAAQGTGIQAHMEMSVVDSLRSFMTKPYYALESEVYNAMIKPIQPYANAGVLWYQGEENSARNEHRTYKDLISAMINSWRSQWGDSSLPFILVQLPGYSKNGIYKWPIMREGYVKLTKEMENVGTIVTADTGEQANIHPKEKKPLGLRLAAVAEHMVYGLDVPYMSPMYKEMNISGKEVTLTFDYAENGFEVKNGTEIIGFEVCGEDQLFAAAKAKIIGTNKIAVWSDKVTKPIAVRYGWEQFPGINLYNKEGFPVCPFRTDDFDPNTKKMQ